MVGGSASFTSFGSSTTSSDFCPSQNSTWFGGASPSADGGYEMNDAASTTCKSNVCVASCTSVGLVHPTLRSDCAAQSSVSVHTMRRTTGAGALSWRVFWYLQLRTMRLTSPGTAAFGEFRGR